MMELLTFVTKGNIVTVFYNEFEEVQAARKEATEQGVWSNFTRFDWAEEDYRKAADEATVHTGLRLAEDGWWDSCIRNVRNAVLRLLDKKDGGLKISDDELLNGQDEHLRTLKSLLGLPGDSAPGMEGAPNVGESREVGIVGVKGMGGVGKTTLAKKLFDEPDVREYFSGGVCWLEVGPKPDSSTVCRLQEQLLRELCGLTTTVGNPTMGRAQLRERLQGKKVLICLDDVWESCATATQVVTVGDLSGGSRILKTTRVKAAVGGAVHDLDALSEGPAWELFCWHAFDGKMAPDSLASAAEQAAKRCGGLPLALGVLGRQVATAEDKVSCLEDFLRSPKDDDAMTECRAIIHKSYETMSLESPRLKDVFVLVAGLWPLTLEFLDQQRAVENLGAAVFWEEPVDLRHHLASKYLSRLRDLSLIGLVQYDRWSGMIDGPASLHCSEKAGKRTYILVHDLIVDVAKAIVNDSLVRPSQREILQLSLVGEGTTRPISSHWRHVRISSGSVSSSFLTSPDSNIASLVLDPEVGFDKQDEIGNTSCCRLLVMSSVQSVYVHRLQLATSLQCLRITLCELDGPVLNPLGALVKLQVLELSCNHSSGQLSRLELYRQRFCGSRPSSPVEKLSRDWAALTGLQELTLTGAGYAVVGQLPPDWAALTGLRNLELRGNRIGGELPPEWKALTRLQILDIRDNELSGMLPPDWAVLTGLQKLSLNLNQLTGSLPVEWATLTGLRTLYLSNNQLTGSLPPGWAALTGMQSLSLSHNPLMGHLPPEWSVLTGLQRLSLLNNSISGELPSEWKALTGLKSLFLHRTKLSGPLPSEWAALTGLTYLDLSYNQHTGRLPPEWAALTSLQKLRLQGNQLTGSLPPEWAALTGLSRMFVDSNPLSGSLPGEWAALTGLEQLSLHDKRYCKDLYDYDRNSRYGGLDLRLIGWGHNAIALPE